MNYFELQRKDNLRLQKVVHLLQEQVGFVKTKENIHALKELLYIFDLEYIDMLPIPPNNKRKCDDEKLNEINKKYKF